MGEAGASGPGTEALGLVSSPSPQDFQQKSELLWKDPVRQEKSTEKACVFGDYLGMCLEKKLPSSHGWRQQSSRKH